jgi:hypothetical protein
MFAVEFARYNCNDLWDKCGISHNRNTQCAAQRTRMKSRPVRVALQPTALLYVTHLLPQTPGACDVVRAQVKHVFYCARPLQPAIRPSVHLISLKCEYSVFLCMLTDWLTSVVAWSWGRNWLAVFIDVFFLCSNSGSLAMV